MGTHFLEESSGGLGQIQQPAESRWGWAPGIEKESHSTRGLQKQPAEDPNKTHGGAHGYQGDKSPSGGV